MYPKDKLDNGDFAEKTSILADLGSNFILYDGILCIDLDSTLSVFKNNHEIVNQSLQGFELEDKLLLEENQPILNAWLGIGEEARTLVSKTA